MKQFNEVYHQGLSIMWVDRKSDYLMEVYLLSLSRSNDALIFSANLGSELHFGVSLNKTQANK